MFEYVVGGAFSLVLRRTVSGGVPRRSPVPPLGVFSQASCQWSRRRQRRQLRQLHAVAATVTDATVLVADGVGNCGRACKRRASAKGIYVQGGSSKGIRIYI